MQVLSRGVIEETKYITCNLNTNFDLYTLLYCTCILHIFAQYVCTTTFIS